MYICCGHTAPQQGIDGLSVLARLELPRSVQQHAVPVLQTAAGSDQSAVLGSNGSVLLYKRLESGSFQCPRKYIEARVLIRQQYRWLMEELNIDQHKANKLVKGLKIV